MTSIESYLEKRAHASNSERVLFSEDGLTIAATAGLGLSHINAYSKFSKFNSFKTIETEKYEIWKEEFSENFRSKMDEFEGLRFQQNNEFLEIYDKYYGEITEGLKNISRRLGNDDNRRRWMFEQFFAKEGGEGAERVLGYHSFKDKESVYKNYSPEQLEELKETGKVSVNGETLEVHHINSKALLLEDPEMFFVIHHVNNGRIMTGRGQKVNNAHHDDPNLGHGGSYKNLTRGEATEVHDRKTKIVEENKNDLDENISSQKELIDEKISSFNLQTGIGVGLIVGLISTVLEIRKLKNDPRPWKKKSLLVATSSLVKGFEAGTLALLALKTRTTIASLGESETLESNLEIANNFLTQTFPGDLTATLDAENIATFAGFSTSIAELRIIRSGIVAIAQWRQSDFKTAFNAWFCLDLSSVSTVVKPLSLVV